MKRLADFRKQVIAGWTVQRIAAVLIVVGLVVFAAGVVNKHCACAGWPNLGETLNDVVSDFYANVSVDCLSVAFAILVIDRLNERRAEQELKAQLIREMGSTDNAIATRAVRELDARGWLADGSLERARLERANLQEVDLQWTGLQKVDLTGANLHKAMLRGCSLHKATLVEADLRDAVLRLADLSGADISGANLTHADLRDACLDGAELIMSDLHNADLSEASLEGAVLRSADLEGADLQDANMTKADLEGATLRNANLERACLFRADLQEALLTDANLHSAILQEAKLQDARELSDQQLVLAFSLRDAMMPDGGRYDGRFNLIVDVEEAVRQNLSTEDPQAMASFYGVSLDIYLRGREWMRENLPSLHHDVGLVENLADWRRERNLDPNNGLPVEPTNGTEPQPADAPTQPAPRRNGHKASMVTHRVRR